jgi:hypothetical protein
MMLTMPVLFEEGKNSGSMEKCCFIETKGLGSQHAR